MLRKIIKIDSNLCIGCKLCINACKESAIELINGKATLIREDYCDGLGNCLPNCPTNAIIIEEREALDFNKEAVNIRKKELNRVKYQEINLPSELQQWPIQINLISDNAGFLANSDLLIAADCTAFANANFHKDFMKEKITMIGCPKFDVNYYEKFVNLFTLNNIKSITVVRMVVPCCSKLAFTVKKALDASNKRIEYHEIILDTNGNILN